ncbi:MAG: glycerophosphoryl diester phosphodiesterase [Nitrospira sp.]|nr:glycerophosphoryl diester phosphodiesterase [Nitrospira sp.]
MTTSSLPLQRYAKYGREVRLEKKPPLDPGQGCAGRTLQTFSGEVTIDSILRIGHRGAAGHAPENTLAAIWKARSFHADFVEIDLRETSDGHLVLLHDETIDRTTNKSGTLAELSLEQVQRLDAGNWQRIPTLEEALDISGKAMGVILELKVEGIGNEACAIVKRVGFSGPLIYASFLLAELHRVRQADPAAQIMVLQHRHLPLDPVAEVVALHASYVGLHYSTVTPALLQTYHDLGKHVFAYTVNDPKDLRRMRELGVDGIVSDFPDRI